MPTPSASSRAASACACLGRRVRSAAAPAPWAEACEACAKELVAALDELGVDFFNLGPATTAAGRALLVPLLKLSPRLTATCVCASNTPPPTEEGAKGASSTSSRTSSSGAVFSPPGDDHTALIDEAAMRVGKTRADFESLLA